LGEGLAGEASREDENSICWLNPTCASRPVCLSYARSPIFAGRPSFVTNRLAFTPGSLELGVCKSPDVSVDFGFRPVFFEDCLCKGFVITEYMGYVIFTEYFVYCYACSADAGE